jgi:hypothetical protein
MATVQHCIPYRVIDGSEGAGTVTFTYDTDRPLVVDMTFGIDQDSWQVWRDILARRSPGSTTIHILDEVAEGGVTCAVIGAAAHLILAGWDRGGKKPWTVTLLLDAATLHVFLARTDEMVPPGTETFLDDAELYQLLKRGVR